MVDDEPHYLSRFHSLVRVAQHCSKKVDYFDLTSEPQSKSEFACLKADAEEAALALIDFIVAHHQELYKQLQK